MPSGGMTLRMEGDWVKANILMQNLQTKLTPFMNANLYDKGEYVLKILKGHIESQDLNWTPLSQHTINIKGGSTNIMLETGYLKDNLIVRRLKSSVKGSTIVIGASPWKVHAPSGEKLSKIMMWLEYGTNNMPPRPLLRPTFDEIKPLMEREWREALRDFINKGGSG